MQALAIFEYKIRVYINIYIYIYIYMYSIISPRGWEVSEMSEMLELRGYLAPQKHCYFTHGSRLSHFEATVCLK